MGSRSQENYSRGAAATEDVKLCPKKLLFETKNLPSKSCSKYGMMINTVPDTLNKKTYWINIIFVAKKSSR
jgi:hypothetical protein